MYDWGEALDYFVNAAAGNGERVDLPYAEWQKRGYERLKGVELPGYYYMVPGTEGNRGEGELGAEAWEGDYIFYDGLTVREGQVYHVICYRMKGDEGVHLVNDDTGEIRGE